MEPHSRSKLNTQIYEEACEWFVECRDGGLDVAARRELDRWLRKSPEHLSAYLEIAAIWNEGPSLDPLGKWDTDTLIAQAAKDHENIVSISRKPPDGSLLGISSLLRASTAPGQRLLRKEKAWARNAAAEGLSVRHAVAASIVFVLLTVGAFIGFQRYRVPTYTTAIGEQRSLELADGSTVELNSRSRIKVRYSEHERAVELLEGEALFHVAKDGARPFMVRSDGTRVRAVGTQFDVYKKRGETIVTVVEGRVAILTNLDTAAPGTVAPPVALPPSDGKGRGVKSSPPGSSGSAETAAPGTANRNTGSATAIFLSAGEQLTVTPKTAQKTDRPNIAGATAWRQRQLVFESASLSEVAEEFNRYNERQVIIEDPELYDFHISGVFSSTDPDSLIRFLRDRPGVRVVETASEIRVAKNIS
ncbi:MAG: FecR family protein [Steroidobacteraceae bacterium]